MKNIIFTLIMATSTALFALPSDSSMAIAQDSSSLKENVEAKARNISRRHHSGNNHDGRVGPTGPTGPAGSGFTPEFGEFYTKNGIAVQSNSIVNLDSRAITSANVQSVADVTFPTASLVVNPGAVAISSVGIYKVTFGASTTSGTLNGVVQLRLNGATLGRTRIELEDHLTSYPTFISIDANALSNGQAGAAILELFAPTGFTLGSQGTAEDDILAFINVQKISDTPVVNP